jgi:cytochrome c biogenesis protein CcmG, thiol:disulfide interchange protein DsbE
MARLSPLMILPPVIFAGLATMFYLGMQREDPDALPSVQIGREAPPVALTPLGPGAPFDDAALRAPGVKIVNYWASWCAPCRVEHPHLMTLAAEGIPIYGINYKDDPEKALGFLAELGDPYAALGADTTGRTAIDWGVYGVPETYVLDGDGRVLFRLAGPVTSMTLENQVRPAIAAAQAAP